MRAMPEGSMPGFLVWRLSTEWRLALDRALAPVGLTHAQYWLMASLFGLQGSGLRPSQRELADHSGLEPLYVSKLARSLESAGLIERTGHPTDARAIQLSLTAEGGRVARRAVTIVRQLLDQLLAPLGGIGGERTMAFVDELLALLD